MADELKGMHIDGRLLQSAWESRIIHLFCEGCFCPSIWECIGNKAKAKEYAEGKEKADELYRRIMADPKMKKRALKAYSQYAWERVLWMESNFSGKDDG